MAKVEVEVVEEKPIAELNLQEAFDRLTAAAKERSRVIALGEECEALAQRISELYTPVEEMDMFQLQQEVMKLDKFKCDVIKPFYEREKEVFMYLFMTSGPGFRWDGDEVEDEDSGVHWQDEDGIVWATEQRTGTFIEYKPFGVTRTRNLDRGEKQGLSMTKARKLGYLVEGK